MRIIDIFLVFVLSVTGNDAGVNFTNAGKPHTLAFLHTSTHAFVFPPKAIGLFFEIVNSRKDILPDYHVNLFQPDEGYGVNGVSALVNFYREPENVSTIGFHIPLSLGPYWSTSCVPLGKLLHHMDLVAFSPTCTSPVLDDKKTFPNLYLMKSTFRYSAMGILRFVRQIGSWNRFGIITQTESSLDFQGAFFLFQTARSEGFEIDFYDWDLNFVSDETMKALKNSDVRIIALHLTSVTKEVFYHFLCKAYRFGITGAKYVFLSNHEALPVKAEDIFAEGYFARTQCTWGIIQEQSKRILLYGRPKSPEEGSKTSVGIDPIEFGEKYNERFESNTPLAELSLYYDVGQKVIVTMQKADDTLKAHYNLSLRSYNKQPKIISKVVKETLQNSEFYSIQNGLMKYSPNGYVENDYQQLSLIVSETHKIVNVATIYKRTGEKDFVYDSYFIEIWNFSLWKEFTLPKFDRMQLVKVTEHVSSDVFYVFTALSAVLFIGDLAGLVLSITKCTWKSVPLVGCFLVKVSVLMFCKSETDNSRYWTTCYVSMALGLSLIYGPLSINLSVIKEEYLTQFKVQSRLSKGRASSRRRRTPANIIKIGRVTSCNKGRKIIVRSVPGILITVALLLVWLSIDSIQCEYTMKSGYESDDKLLEIWGYQCNTSKLELSVALLILTIPQSIILLFGVLIGYQLSRWIKHYKMSGATVYLTSVILMNILTLLLLGVVANFIFSGQTSVQIIFTSILALLTTAMTSFCLVYPEAKNRYTGTSPK